MAALSQNVLMRLALCGLAAVMQRCANTLEKNYEDYNQ